MSDFICWDPGNEDEPGTYVRPGNRITDVIDVAEAAEQYAATCLEGNDPFTEITIMVRDMGGKRHAVKVTVDYEPVFYAEVQP